MEKISKSDVVSRLASTLSVSKRQAKEVFNTVDSLLFNLIQEGAVQLKVGTLKRVHKPARTGTKPGTQERITISARDALKLSPSTAVKRALNP